MYKCWTERAAETVTSLANSQSLMVLRRHNRLAGQLLYVERRGRETVGAEMGSVTRGSGSPVRSISLFPCVSSPRQPVVHPSSSRRSLEPLVASAAPEVRTTCPSVTVSIRPAASALTM